MLDLETMGNGKDGAIVAIGAFTWPQGEILDKAKIGHFYKNVELGSSLEKGMTITPSTIYWWLAQSEMARKSILENATSLPVALEGLRHFVRASKVDHVWCHKSFDAVIIDEAYMLCELQRPWAYRDVKDLRTMAWKYPYIIQEYNQELAHNALNDAIRQAHYLEAMLIADSLREGEE
jgi:hypothetical protein